jgi:hypothetical protein
MAIEELCGSLGAFFLEIAPRCPEGRADRPERLSKIACFPSREFPEKPNEKLHLINGLQGSKRRNSLYFPWYSGNLMRRMDLQHTGSLLRRVSGDWVCFLPHGINLRLPRKGAGSGTSVLIASCAGLPTSRR